MKIVINGCYGGFGISKKCAERMAELGDEQCREVIAEIEKTHGKWYSNFYSGGRNNPILVQDVEELGEVANGDYAELVVVEIPDGVEWEIDEYDGIEKIDEVHRSWS